MWSGKTEGTAVFLSNGLFPAATVAVKKMIAVNTQYQVVLLLHIPCCIDVWLSNGQQPQVASFQISNQQPMVTLKTQNVTGLNMTLGQTHIVDYLVSLVGYQVHPLRLQFWSNSSPCQFDCGMFYRACYVNTHVVSWFSIYEVHLTYIYTLLYIIRLSLLPGLSLPCFCLQSACLLIGDRSVLSLLFPPHNRIFDCKCWTCLIFTISNLGSHNHLRAHQGG